MTTSPQLPLGKPRARMSAAAPGKAAAWSRRPSPALRAIFCCPCAGTIGNSSSHITYQAGPAPIG